MGPSETESAAWNDGSKLRPYSPTQKRYRECFERFPRKDPRVFDLIGSSLSCDTTAQIPPNGDLCLHFAELLKHPQQRPKRVA